MASVIDCVMVEWFLTKQIYMQKTSDAILWVETMASSRAMCTFYVNFIQLMIVDVNLFIRK